jgi:hypothetical protein
MLRLREPLVAERAVDAHHHRRRQLVCSTRSKDGEPRARQLLLQARLAHHKQRRALLERAAQVERGRPARGDELLGTRMRVAHRLQPRGVLLARSHPELLVKK